MMKVGLAVISAVLLMSSWGFADPGYLCTKVISNDAGPGYLTVDDSQSVNIGKTVVIMFADKDGEATLTKGMITATISAITSGSEGEAATLGNFNLRVNGSGNPAYDAGTLLYQNKILKLVSLNGVSYQCQTAN